MIVKFVLITSGNEGALSAPPASMNLLCKPPVKIWYAIWMHLASASKGGKKNEAAMVLRVLVKEMETNNLAVSIFFVQAPFYQISKGDEISIQNFKHHLDLVFDGDETMRREIT